ncbi:MAG TPA: response regulator [Pyrinomonadaceae bacterium]|nr:response regulator [Pyrinomonadaceae bacterium]
MASPPKNHRILYVEDHVDTVEMVTLMLEGAGFNVSSRRTIAEGVTAASQEKFDLYLIDLWLPDGSGMELCKKIREFDSATPIAFYSAAAYEGDKEAALESGAQAYLIKPTDSLSMVESLLHLIGRVGNGNDGKR